MDKIPIKKQLAIACKWLLILGILSTVAVDFQHPNQHLPLPARQYLLQKTLDHKRPDIPSVSREEVMLAIAGLAIIAVIVVLFVQLVWWLKHNKNHIVHTIKRSIYAQKQHSLKNRIVLFVIAIAMVIVGKKIEKKGLALLGKEQKLDSQSVLRMMLVSSVNAIGFFVWLIGGLVAILSGLGLALTIVVKLFH